MVGIKVGLLPSKKSCYLLHLKPFKNSEKCFFNHLKSLFHSQDIYIFVMTSWSCRENCLIRKIRLILRFMMLQPGQEAIATDILHNISWSKDNQTMKPDKLREYNKRDIVLQKPYRKWAWKTSSRTLFIFLKSLI